MHGRPHLRFCNGRWYAHSARETSLAIASGRTPLEAWINYQALEASIASQMKAISIFHAPVVENPFIPKFIITAWRRIRGKRG